jgi:integration host factor subunit beta
MRSCKPRGVWARAAILFLASRNRIPSRDEGSGRRGITMTKADLIDEVSRAVDMTRKDSELIVETIFESIVGALRASDKIEIRGFGSFRTRQRQSRVGRNPKTGARVEVPPKKVPYFKPSKDLKDLINGSNPVATSM